jgi:hypothetical protein
MILRKSGFFAKFHSFFFQPNYKTNWQNFEIKGLRIEPERELVGLDEWVGEGVKGWGVILEKDVDRVQQN